ncbi:MAG: SDR family oxidoreductase, partial [Bacteroidetes bacterium]|nr:SDR family oxidoreductase [Bacteroidota bacterium]
MKALLAGATGLCGNELLRLLLESNEFEKVYILVRKPLEDKHPKLIQIVTNFENIDQDLAAIHVDYIYCCLGTTIKKAGSQEAFNKVDNLYVQQLVNWGEKRAVKYFGVISA